MNNQNNSNCCNQSNNNQYGCGCPCPPPPKPSAPADVNMNICEKTALPLSILQTYTTKVLKLNINGCCKRNLLTQSMLSCENYKYIIKWDFDLGGQTIKVPKNCILEFDGGSLKNGTIIGQDTLFINDGDVTIWGENLTREGTWREHSGGGGSSEEDKPYDPSKHSGLGRKTLELGEDGSNILTQEDFNQENTIYVVGYDFDLNGETIKMPAGSVLEMDGGSFSNGRIWSTHTVVKGNLPENSDVFFGIFYRDGYPLNYNMKVTRALNTVVSHAFMTPGAYVSYKFYPQDIVTFRKNQSKYYLLTGNIEGTNPERAFMVLLDRNFDYIGSTEIPLPCHGGGTTICDDKLYMGTHKYPNPDPEHPDRKGIAVYSLDNVIATCTAEGGDTHSDTYATKIQYDDFIMLNHTAGWMDYDEVNEEFVVGDGDSECHFYYKDFTPKLDRDLNRKHGESWNLNIERELTDYFQSNVILQGIIMKNGVIYGNGWVSDWESGSPDRGSNILFSYDTIKNEVISFDWIESSYHNPETEGLCKDCDDDNNFYYLTGINTEGGSTILGIGKASYVNVLYGLDSKRAGKPGLVNSLRGTLLNVDNTYDYRNGPSNGSMERPFKNLDSAIATAFAVGSDFFFYIRKTFNPNAPDKEYVMPSISLGNNTMTIEGVGNIPTLRGYARCYGGSLRLSNLKFIPTQSRGIYTSNNGFLYLNSVTIQKDENIQTQQEGVYLTDCSTMKIEGTTAFVGFTTGLNCRHSRIKGVLNARNCTLGAYFMFCDIGFNTIAISGCTTGIEARRTPIHFVEASFTDTTTCIKVDDSPIDNFGIIKNESENPNYGIVINGTVENVITKDSWFRGNVNYISRVTTAEELQEFFNFINKGIFSATSVGFRVMTEGIVYNGIPIIKGEYFYDNPGFMHTAYPHKMVTENDGVFTFIATKGTTAQRPVLTVLYAGFKYFDTSINLPVVWDGNNWIELSDGTWEKVGEITPATTIFNNLPVSKTENTYHSESSAWTHAVDGTIYNRIYLIDGNPFNAGDVIKFKIVNGTENYELRAAYYDSISSAREKTADLIDFNAFNIVAKNAVIPSVPDWNALSLEIRCDVEYSNATIEIYKKTV